MTAPGWALQRALYDTLSADTDLTAALGSGRIFDHVPRGRSYPYMTFSQSTVRDWSTATEPGHEHVVTFHVWSDAAGREEADTILAAAVEALHDKPMTLDGHHLVNLRADFTEVRRDPDGETFHGLLRLRAVTEPTA